MLKYRELIAGLRKGTLLPVYLFFGEEEYQVREAVDLILGKAVDAGARDFNYNAVSCRETPAAELVGLCQTLPFMSERRLVIARDVDAYKTDDIAELAAYLNDPAPSTCLVLLSQQPKFDKKPVLEAVEAHGAVTRFYALLDGEVVPWIEGWGRSRGIAVRPDAAQYLWQLVGNDLQRCQSELEKAEIFVKDRKTITLEDMKQVAGDFREFTPFDLADAVCRKNRDEAFLILTRLVQEGEQPVGLLGSLAWSFRRLTQAKAMEASGTAPEEAMKKLRPPVIFHQMKRFREQMRKYGQEELRDVFGLLLTADRSLKSSALPGRLVLERLILRLCNG